MKNYKRREEFPRKKLPPHHGKRSQKKTIKAFSLAKGKKDNNVDEEENFNTLHPSREASLDQGTHGKKKNCRANGG